MNYYIVLYYSINLHFIKNVSSYRFLTTKYFVGKNSVHSLLTFTFAGWFI